MSLWLMASMNKVRCMIVANEKDLIYSKLYCLERKLVNLQKKIRLALLLRGGIPAILYIPLFKEDP